MIKKNKNFELISHKLIKQTLANKPFQGKHHLEPLRKLVLAKNLPFSLLEDHAITETESEIHLHEHDLWHCLGGEATFTCGGKLIKPWVRKGSAGKELGGHGIKNGTKVKIQAGDWLWIPAGQPHQHIAAKTARMMIIKIKK